MALEASHQADCSPEEFIGNRIIADFLQNGRCCVVRNFHVPNHRWEESYFRPTSCKVSEATCGVSI